MNKIILKDKAVADAINNEAIRQANDIELIASENYVSQDVLIAAGSILTNKYSEGYPGARYYNGCKNIDIVEQLAIDRICQLFNIKYANVQPHSGSSANAAAIAALVEPGAKILGMGLNAGGHLTHGYNISFSGVFYKAFSYNVDDNGFLNYEDIKKIALEFKPNLIICGASSYSRIIDFKKFREIADLVGAKLMADVAHIAGLIVTGFHPTPVGYADVITSTTHKTLRGARGGIILTNSDELIKKINRWVFPGYQGGPLPHIIAAKAISFYEALDPSFIEYQKQVVLNSKAFANEFIKLGADIITGGTDNHLFNINVKKTYNLTGKQASELLEFINITVNKNSIPNDAEKPFHTSGVRMGTPAMTSRGLKEKDFQTIAQIIDKLLRNKNNQDLINQLKAKVSEITKEFPIRNEYI